MDIQTIDKEIKRLKELKKSIIAQNKVADKANKTKLQNWQKSLYKARYIAGYSQTELGEAIGVKKQSIYKWENSKQPIPIERAKQLSKVLSLKL